MITLTSQTVSGVVSLKTAYIDGKVAVAVWVNNEVAATFYLEYVWDLIEDILVDNPPKDVPGSLGSKTNYIDGGRRYKQIMTMRSVEV